MCHNDIFEEFKSGFSASHGTETALVNKLNVPFICSWQRRDTVLIILDISAASDTVDSATVMTCLETWMSVKGTALRWFYS